MQYVAELVWVVDSASHGHPQGIYVERSLRENDPFYKRQIGPEPFCTQKDMAKLDSLVEKHEIDHWIQAYTMTTPLQTETKAEKVVQFPGTQDPTLVRQVFLLDSTFRAAVSIANDFVEDVLDPLQQNAPVCNMRP